MTVQGSKAAFLDRDGVINVDYGYVYRIEDFHFIDGVFDACRRLQDLDYRLIVITNQAGIAQGYYSEADFQRLNDWMLREFAANSVRIDGVYYCPYHPEAALPQYRRESPHRKPNPQMLLDAAGEHKVDLPASFLAGDKLSDLAAGRAAGVQQCFYIGDAADLAGEYAGVAAFGSLWQLVQSEFPSI